MNRKYFLLVALSVVCFVPSLATSSELSLVSGLYKSSKDKADKRDAGSESQIRLGARFAAPINATYDWFVRPIFTMRSYDAADGQKSASDSTSLNLAGGIRWNFREFATKITPFLEASGAYKSDSYADQSANTQTEVSGLFYGANAGFRFQCTDAIFFDLATPFFDSALSSTKKTEPIDRDKPGAPVETETTRTELYVDSFGSLDATIIGVGYIF